MTDKTGGAAFPVPATELHGIDTDMTLRDYFAAEYMQSRSSAGYSSWDDLAHDAYEMADAMLKARG